MGQNSKQIDLQKTKQQFENDSNKISGVLEKFNLERKQKNTIKKELELKSNQERIGTIENEIVKIDDQFKEPLIFKLGDKLIQHRETSKNIELINQQLLNLNLDDNTPKPLQEIVLGSPNQNRKTQQKMANIKEILEIFNVDKITNNILPYDGSKTDLVRFLDSVDNTIQICQNLDKESQHYKIIISNIRNKITGIASNSLITHNVDTKNWKQMKEHLVSKYADSRDESNLQFELYSLVRNNLSPQNLFDKIQNLLTLLINQVKLHNDNQEIITHQINQYNQVGLTIFTAGLKEPLGGRIRSMQPKNLIEAYDFITKEQNINKLKYNNQSTSNYKNNTYTKQESNKTTENNNTNNTISNTNKNFSSNYKPNYTPNNKKKFQNNYWNNKSPKTNEETNSNAQIKREIKTEHFNIETEINDEIFN